MQNLKFNNSFRRGQALVEFALVLPVLLVLTMLIIQYGIIFYTTIGLTNLSREGARYAATLPASSDDDIVATQQASTITRMEDVLPPSIKWSDLYISATNNNFTFTYLDKDGAESDTPVASGLVKVTITYNMSNKLFLPSTFLGAKIFSTNYTTSTTMMIES
jgi:Flp pilus assembly protein TadG